MSLREFLMHLRAARSASTSPAGSRVRGHVMPGGSIRYEEAELLRSVEVRELIRKLASMPEVTDPSPPAGAPEGEGHG